MRQLSSADILEVWEEGHRRPIGAATAALVATADPELSPSVLRSLPLGAFQARLAELHRQLRGPSLEAFARCPGCEARLEFSLATSDLPSALAAAGDGGEVAAAGVELRYRVLSVGDLEAAAACADLATARQALVEAAVLEATIDDRPIAPSELPEAAVGALAERLAEHDPGAETVLALSCPGCGQAWEAQLDLSAFVWAEVTAAAERLLEEVAHLGRAYGWSEGEVLAMGPARRRRYLELAG